MNTHRQSELPILENPTYTDKIPSSGADFSYRPYLVKEESILQLAKESEDKKIVYQAIRDIIKACTLGTIDEKTLVKLPIFDIKFIFMKLRCVSVGENVTIRVECDKCGYHMEKVIPIDKLNVENDKEVDNKIELGRGVGCVLRYPSLSSTMDISSNNTKENNEGEKRINDVLLMYAKCIETVYKDDDVFDIDQISDKGLLEFIKQFSKEKLENIQKFLEGMPSFKTDVIWECKKCKKENKFEVDDIESFFT